MGRAALGSQTRVESIVSYSPSAEPGAFARVYVEEITVRSTAGRSAAPIHVLRCHSRPQNVRFIELPDPRRSRSPVAKWF